MTLPWDERKPKLHTIRRDKTNRWHTDLQIDFITGNRYQEGGGGLFNFAPKIKPASIQEIEMKRDTEGDWPYPFVYVREQGDHLHEGRPLDGHELEKLAINDGFKDVDSFAAYFLPPGTDEYTGRIIHWTNLKY